MATTTATAGLAGAVMMMVTMTVMLVPAPVFAEVPTILFGDSVFSNGR